MAKSLVFGGNVSESLASYDHESSCWRTSQLSLFGEDEKWLEALPKSGMTQSGKLYQLGCSVRLISDVDGFASVILPTPTAKANQAAPTMRKHWKGLLPTPTAHLAKETGAPSEYNRDTLNLICHFQKKEKDIGKRQVLSPLFVEWMMGFPIGWTDLER